MVRILLADDRIVARRGLRALPRDCPNFDVCAEACNSSEAIELAVSHKPNVAILDIELPIVERNRGHPPNSQGDARDRSDDLHAKRRAQNIRDVLDAGARGYVFKSEPDEQIIKAIETLARHRAFFSSQISNALLDNFVSHQVQSAIIRRPSPRANARSFGSLPRARATQNIAYLLDISVKTVERTGQRR